jgi:hypothetical protein
LEMYTMNLTERCVGHETTEPPNINEDDVYCGIAVWRGFRSQDPCHMAGVRREKYSASSAKSSSASLKRL